MKKLAVISDIIFYSFSGFLLLLCLLRFYCVPLILSFVFAVVFGTLCGTLTFLLIRRKLNKNNAKTLKEKAEKETLNHFAYIGDRKTALFFSDYLSIYGDQLESASYYQHKNGTYYIESPRMITYPIFRILPVNENDVLPAVSLSQEKPVQIFCSEITESAKAFASGFGIKTVSGSEIYKRLEDSGQTPKDLIHPINKKATFQEKKRICFSKKNCKSFFLSGFFLLISSLISPFPLYYLVFGGVLFIIALLIRIFGYS